MSDMKKAYLFVLALILLLPAAAGALAPDEYEAIDGVLDFRMRLTALPSPDDAVAAADAYMEKISRLTEDGEISAEASLIIMNMLVWEKYNYIYETDMNSPVLEELLMGQYRILTEWLSTHRGEKHDKWLYCSAGDILSSGLRFFAVGTAMKEGLNVKKYYDAVLAEDPDMCFALFNIAHWYFFAPGISGGSKRKAAECFARAEQAARNDAELFFAKAYHSQMLYENGDTAGCGRKISEAERIMPGSRYTEKLRRVNAAGHSIFYYTLNKEKMDRELADAEGGGR